MKMEIFAYDNISTTTEKKYCEYQEIIDMVQGKFGYILAENATSLLSHCISVEHCSCGRSTGPCRKS
jgi:hypothetical protein